MTGPSAPCGPEGEQGPRGERRAVSPPASGKTEALPRRFGAAQVFLFGVGTFLLLGFSPCLLALVLDAIVPEEHYGRVLPWLVFWTVPLALPVCLLLAVLLGRVEGRRQD